MNKIEKHETDHECNVCHTHKVVNEYGRKRCDNIDCPASKSHIDIGWDSTDEEIEAWREEQDPDLETEMERAEAEFDRDDPESRPLDLKVVHGPNNRMEIEDRDLFLESLAREFKALAEIDRNEGRDDSASTYSSMANTIRSHKDRPAGRA